MRWEEWQPLYFEIVQELNLNPSEDRRATKVLSMLIEHIETAVLLSRLKSNIEGKDIVICGAGPSLGKGLDWIKNEGINKRRAFIAADGATTAFIERDMICDIIVSDLDGKIEDIRKMMEEGALGIIHAHGDNISKIKSVVPDLGDVLGSTQVEPVGNVHLWGGFTDGDRACYIASHYHPKSVILLGMDFGNIVGHWSKPEHNDDFLANERKRKKLVIAKRLISDLRLRGKLPVSLIV